MIKNRVYSATIRWAEMCDAIWRRFIKSPSHRPCLLDVRRCNIFARYKRLEIRTNSQTFGGISSVQWRKVVRI